MAMDINYEDKIYNQIEKNLSNNINDKLFVPIEIIDDNTYKGRKKKTIVDSVSYEENMPRDNPNSYDNRKAIYEQADNNIDGYNQGGPTPRLSRAEYIRQAREACLRQMNAGDISGRINDLYVGVDNTTNSYVGRKKKDKVDRLFQEGSDQEDYNEEFASYRSLIIRTVCALVIFLCIFIIDKIKVDWGKFSYETIRQYVTANDKLKVLEEIIVSWLK